MTQFVVHEHDLNRAKVIKKRMSCAFVQVYLDCAWKSYIQSNINIHFLSNVNNKPIYKLEKKEKNTFPFMIKTYNWPVDKLVFSFLCLQNLFWFDVHVPRRMLECQLKAFTAVFSLFRSEARYRNG